MPKPVQYEYKIVYHGTLSEKKTNRLGSQGWELAATHTDMKNGDSNITSLLQAGEVTA